MRPNRKPLPKKHERTLHFHILVAKRHKEWLEPAEGRSALERQHELASGDFLGESVRVSEKWIPDTREAEAS